MNFGLGEEQVLLQDNVRRLLTDACSLDRVRTLAEAGDQRALWPALTELGVAALRVPERAGGVELGALDALLVAECLGERVAPTPFLGSAGLLPEALRRAEGQHDALLGQLAAGTLTAGIAIAEAFGRRGDAGIEADGDRLNGKALYVLDFDADLYLVADREQALFLVSATAEGLEQRRLPTVDRTRGTGELVLRHTPAQRLTDDPAVLAAVRELGWILLAADTLGAAQAMLDAAVAYARERRQFNRPIGSFQAVKHLCAEMAAALEPARAMLWYAGHAFDQGLPEAPLLAAQTKAHLSEVGTFIARTATEVHGGMGFTDLLGLHYWFKRIGWNRQLLGAPELLRQHAARLQGL